MTPKQKANLAELGDEHSKVDSSECSDISIANIKERQIHQQYIETLSPYLALAEEVKSTNSFTAMATLSKLSKGLRIAGELCATATYSYSQARSERKKAEAIAALDDFLTYAEQKDLKPTDKLREYYVNQHEGVLKAKEQEAYFEAIKEQVYTMKMELLMAITSIRQSAYGFKDSNLLSTFASSHGDEDAPQ